MRFIMVLVIVTGLLEPLAETRSIVYATQANEGRKPKVSEVPLTTEQIAIYRAVLAQYVKSTEGSLNLADTTYPLGSSGMFGVNEGCLKEIKLEPVDKSAIAVHRLDPAVALSAKMKLVNSDEQEKMIRGNDPQIIIKDAIEGGGKVSDKQIEDSVKRAFETGLFSFSEIGFDKEHRSAVVEYSFVCGSLCGGGSTLALKKSGGKWKIRRRCGGWVS
jgi:hypothetical protein